MFIFASKILPLLIYPLGLALILIVCAVLVRRRVLRTVFLVTALLILWIASTRWAAVFLVRSLEWQFHPPAQSITADAIVVLGGSTRSDDPPRPLIEISESGDRILYAAWLYNEGRAPLIITTGGGIDWRSVGRPEADLMRDQLLMLGVAPEHILVEPDSRNTYENALNTRSLLADKGVDNILLVTSALHMPRSIQLFRQQGFDVTPAPTDYLVSQADWSFLFHPDPRTQVLYLLPDAENLHWTSLALKEYLGTFIYSLRGWL